MKRLNPATGVPFKYGDIREDGYFFVCYKKKLPLRKNGTFIELWTKKNHNDRTKERYVTEEGRTYKIINRCKNRAIQKNIEFNISFDKIKKALTNGFCELTKLPFDFNSTEKTQFNPYSPSIDRINNSKGYIDSNVRVVLSAVNTALNQYGDEQMLPILKAMITGIENAQKKSTTPVSTKDNTTSGKNTARSVIHGGGPWEDSDDANDYRGTTQGENSYRSAKEGSGDSMGHGGKEMEPPATPKDSQDPGDTGSTVNSAEEFFERVRSQSRKLDLATGTTRGSIPKPSN